VYRVFFQKSNLNYGPIIGGQVRTATYFKGFIKMFGSRMLHEISISDLEEYERVRSRFIKTNSLSKELRTLHYLFKQAEQMLASKKWKDKDGNPFHNPFNGFKIISEYDKRDRVLTYEEEERLLSVCAEPLKDIIQVALWTGMRQGEILSLEWNWIDLGENEINIPSSSKKSKRPHRLPIASKLRSLLLRRQLKTKGSSYVFPSPKTDNHLVNVNKGWRKALKNAGIKNLRFHDLRHSFASRLSNRGYSVQEIQLLLSHGDIRTTSRYLSPDKNKLREAVESVSREKSYGLSTDFLNE